MSPRRAIVVLAMLAALVVAPSSVSAAEPNELLGAAITPSAGTTATLFELSVSYSGGNPANAVTATVGGKTVALWLSSGNELDGTWTGATALPQGSWWVTFRADVSRKRDPTALAGPVSVSLGDTQPPESPRSSQPADTTDPTDAPATSEPEPQPSAISSPGGAGAPVDGPAEPSGSTQAAASEGPSASKAGHRDAPHGRSAGARASGSLDGGVAPAQPTAAAGPGGGGQGVGNELVGMVLLIGVVGVAGVALLGAAWIIVASRRDRREPSLVVPPPSDAAVAAIPAVEQRARRRARLRPSDDPILAALGLNDEEPLDPAGGQGDQGRSERRFRRAARNSRTES
jgi:hypothetical protein